MKKNYFKINKYFPQKIWTIEEVKNYLRISHTYDDELLKNIIDTAINIAEDFIGASIHLKEIELISNDNNSKEFNLKFPPIYTLNSLIIIKNSDEEQVLSKEDFYFDIERSLLYLKEHFRKEEEIHVNYIVGYDSENIPRSLKQGILLHIAKIYDREDDSTSLGSEIKNLYFPSRLLRI